MTLRLQRVDSEIGDLVGEPLDIMPYMAYRFSDGYFGISQ